VCAIKKLLSSEKGRISQPANHSKYMALNRQLFIPLFSSLLFVLLCMWCMPCTNKYTHSCTTVSSDHKVISPQIVLGIVSPFTCPRNCLIPRWC